jgi:Protein of unknown function (DUF2442)
MNTLAPRKSSALANGVAFDSDSLLVYLQDGRLISVPLLWFPKLHAASNAQRANWRLIGSGVGLAWDDLDEDISVAGLLSA